MKIAVKGRNTAVTEDLREYVERRFRRLDRQVSPLARQVKRHISKKRGHTKVGTETIRTGAPEPLEEGSEAG